MTNFWRGLKDWFLGYTHACLGSVYLSDEVVAQMKYNRAELAAALSPPASQNEG